MSTIISSDSVTIYSGKSENNTPVQKITLDEKIFKEVLTQKKNKAGKPITVVLKLSQDGGQGGIMESVYNVIHWSKEVGVNSFIIGDDDEKNILRFNSAEDTWRYIDSGFRSPTTLHLNIPKDEEEPVKPVSKANAFTCIVFASDRIYCYQGTKLTSGKFYSIEGTNTFRKLITGESDKRPADSLMVIIKPSEEASYKSTVDILDEMAINKISRYVVVKMTNEEINFLKTKN